MSDKKDTPDLSRNRYEREVTRVDGDKQDSVVIRSRDGDQERETEITHRDGEVTVEDEEKTSSQVEKKKIIRLWEKELFDAEGSLFTLFEGEWAGDYSSIKGYISAFYGKAHLSSKAIIDLDNYAADIDIVDLKLKASVFHGEVEGEFKLGEWFKDTASSLFDFTPSEATGSNSVGIKPLAARVGDPTTHSLAPLAPGLGSPNVLIEGMPAWRALIDTHLCPLDGGGKVLKGSTTVLINNCMASRMGDFVVESTGPNPITMGARTVQIGEAPSFVPPPKTPTSTGLILTGKGEGDFLTTEFDAHFGGKISGIKEAITNLNPKEIEFEAGGKLGGIAAVAEGEIEGELAIPIPFTDHAITLGAKVEGSFMSIGAGAEASVGRTKDHGYQMKAGAKLAFGSGLGVLFSVGFK